MLTPSDEEAIAEYMGWITEPYWWCVKCDEEKAWHHVTNDGRCTDCSCAVIVKGEYNFDLNDAGLCVEKMVEKGDLEDFEYYINSLSPSSYRFYGSVAILWFSGLFNPDNFFTAMSAWVRRAA